MIRGSSPWEKRRLTHWTTQRSGTCPCLLGFQIWRKKLQYIWLAHLSVQSLPPSSTVLRFKVEPYKSHRFMYTMILPLEFAALSSVLSGKFVLFESRRHAHIVCVVEDRDQQHVSPAEALTFHAATVHVTTTWWNYHSSNTDTNYGYFLMARERPECSPMCPTILPPKLWTCGCSVELPLPVHRSITVFLFWNFRLGRHRDRDVICVCHFCRFLWLMSHSNACKMSLQQTISRFSAKVESSMFIVQPWPMKHSTGTCSAMQQWICAEEKALSYIAFMSPIHFML
jgi:hypothetical protein